MELKEAIRERYSVRNYREQEVPKQVIEKILEWTSLAPSAVNFQPWHFIVISEKVSLEAMYDVYHRSWIRSAPLIIVACVNHQESWKRGNDGHDFGEVDVAIAIDHLTLAATSCGLGTCWVCNFDVEGCKKILKLPDHMEPLALIPLGYPASTMPAKKRKSLNEIVSWEEFGKR
jgi:nitroreductase